MRSPVGGMASVFDTGSFVNEAADAKATNCPVCSEAFTITYRRHHCRNCGGLVCEACSPHRLLLPSKPHLGKVRMCNACAVTVGEGHAVNAQEDLNVNAEIVKTIQAELRRMHGECSEGKLVLLEIEAEAEGDRTALEEYLRDPEGDASSFGIVLPRLLSKWAAVCQEALDSGEQQEELQRRLAAEQELFEAVSRQRDELSRQRAEQDTDVQRLNQMRQERDELMRQREELESSLVHWRNEESLLRLEQESRQARQARQTLQGDRMRQCFTSQPPPPPSPRDSYLTVSTGRLPQPAVERGGIPDRLEGCRRSCELM